MLNPPSRRRLVAAALLLCTNLAAHPARAGKAAASPDLPVGQWRCVIINNVPVGRVTCNSDFYISAQGTARYQIAYDCTYHPGAHIGYGKFAGRTRLSWTTAGSYLKLSHVGKEIYCYLSGGNSAHLVSSNPPGYSLNDFFTFGGVISATQGRQMYGPDFGGVTIFEESGRDLILTDSTDHKRYTYKRIR